MYKNLKLCRRQMQLGELQNTRPQQVGGTLNDVNQEEHKSMAIKKNTRPQQLK
jgi:hypothetical protein